MKRRHSWRVKSDERGRFDEIVVLGSQHERGGILRAEMLSPHSCFVNVAGRCFWVHVDKNGVAQITDEEDRT